MASLAEKIHDGLRKHVEKNKAKEKEYEGKKKGGKHHFRVEQMDDGTFSVHHRLVPHGKHEYSEPTIEKSSTHKTIHHVAKHMKEVVGVNDEADTAHVAGEQRGTKAAMNEYE